MKVIKEEDDKDYRTVTLRIKNTVMDQVDRIANKNDLSRQALVAAILKQVMNDPKFVLIIEGKP